MNLEFILSVFINLKHLCGNNFKLTGYIAERNSKSLPTTYPDLPFIHMSKLYMYKYMHIFT